MGFSSTTSADDQNISVLLVDDHAMLRKGMALLLGREADIDVVGEAGDCEQARALQPDVVVMDINMPGVNGIDAIRQIVAEFPAINVIALSIHSGKRFIDDMLGAGAAGYVLKESVPEELQQGIRAVMHGDMYLSSAITSTVVGGDVEGMSAVEENEPPQVDIGILQTKLQRPAAPLDIHGKWLRYHHLFQHLLQHELERRMSAGEIAALHLRASGWFGSRGLIEEAIQHALKAGDVVSAAKFVERHQQVQLYQHHWYIVERWLAMLPLGIIQQRPKLLLTQIWGLYNTFQLL
jgi:DNA-binding NarL/FixJ family response regulator